MIYLPKEDCLIIIRRNTAHFLYMSCCHNHQQPRYHNENTKISMFILYIYVDILFPVTKAIPFMSERVTEPYQTLQTWRGHNATHYHYHTGYRTFSLSLTWMGHNAMPYYNLTCYHMRYHTFFLSLAWFGVICNALPRGTVKFIK